MRVYLAALLMGGVCYPYLAFAAEPSSPASGQLPAAVDREVDFIKDIKPIFEVACHDCHSLDTQEGGLRLDARSRALAGGDSGPVIVPGKSAESRLIHLVAGIDHDGERMPPEGSGDPLTPEQIAVLRAWIDRGAAWPDEAAGDAAVKSDHWSFKPIERPPLPAVENTKWARNPIDAFILARLEAQEIAPSPEADRATLIRRLYLDLIGLPPSPEATSAFVHDQRSGAYERVVDELLESPHYGERWGRYWLDAARYADSDGYEKDMARPFAWRYRDWVIRALNADLPFDRFTVQQIAGDLLTKVDAEYDPAALVATGFHRNTLVNREGGIDPEEDRVKRTIDRTNTVGSVWLGLTVGCANCHTHKYDPITQQEYFQLYAFFNNIEEVDAEVTPDGAAKLNRPDVSPREELLSVLADSVPEGSVDDSAANRRERRRRSEGAMTLAQVVVERTTPRECYVHLRGDFLSKGPTVEPQTLEVLPPLVPRGSQPDRLDLARWLVCDDNPLTARVIANRIWQDHFGRGLVATGDDFGTQGEPPSHPELLDWLASEFMESGWRMKHLHRLIVTSATYRQSAAARPELVDRDPYNAWLAKQNRLRLEAEIIRDAALVASGLFDPTIGGPSIRPPQPPGHSSLTFANSAKWKESVGSDRYRRGLYIWFQRTSPFPALTLFDAPEANLTCLRRERSNTPLQSLTLLNDVVFVECAQALGKRMASSHGEGAEARIRRAYQWCVSRDPSKRELSTLLSLYDDALEECRKDMTVARKIVGSSANDNSPATTAEVAACVAVARALLNLDEFMTRE